MQHVRFLSLSLLSSDLHVALRRNVRRMFRVPHGDVHRHAAEFELGILYIATDNIGGQCTLGTSIDAYVMMSVLVNESLQ